MAEDKYADLFLRSGLDVCEFKLSVTENLKLLNNVVLTPYTGSGTIKSR